MLGQMLGHYRIEEKIGEGGMGVVYRAYDTKLGRAVALKVLPEKFSSDRERLARFEREARSASALNHPNIVTIYEIGSRGPIPYLVMELVVGKSLRELLAVGPLPMYEILRFGARVADGLAKAHAVGIVHRDLTPGNVIITKDGLAKIVDFGLAKLLQGRERSIQGEDETSAPLETHPGTVMGTPSYMSPEQAKGLPLDFRSDQFSFGSLLYEMASGKRAFLRESSLETMMAVLREDPESLARLNPKIPLAFVVIVERCLAKDPKHRYSSTQRLARDLDGLQVVYLLEQLQPVREPVPIETPAGPQPDDAQRKHLLYQLLNLLRGGGAHLGFDEAIADFPPELRGARPKRVEHSAWQLLEHMRLAQWDILEFSRNPAHISPEFPAGYWPGSVAPPDDAAWEKSVRAFRADLEAMGELVADPRTDLFARIPHGQGQTILREALLVADHNAYHLGQLVQLRRLLGAWPPASFREKTMEDYEPSGS